jgi:hypothetical protein
LIFRTFVLIGTAHVSVIAVKIFLLKHRLSDLALSRRAGSLTTWQRRQFVATFIIPLFRVHRPGAKSERNSLAMETNDE